MGFNDRLRQVGVGFMLYVLAHIPLLISVIAIPSYDFDVKDGEQGKHFQGDMILSPEQRKLLLSNVTKQNQQNRFRRWHNGTVFYYLDDVHKDMHWKMQKAAKIIEDAVPCVRFKQLEVSSLQHYPDFVHITSNNSGCFSEVGYKKGRQVMNINDKYCNSVGTILHQLLHVLGMEHMHNNHNRDKYITVIWDNIQDEHKHNFEKFPRNHMWDYYLPYDYDSITHCGFEDFSKNKKPTVIPKDSTVKIGQRRRLSDLDILKLKLLYCTDNINMKNLTNMR